MKFTESGEMPKEVVKCVPESVYTDGNDAVFIQGGKSLQVSWNKIGWVQLAVVPDDWKDTGDWDIVGLSADDISKLMKVLRRAKKQAYSSGTVHFGFES